MFRRKAMFCSSYVPSYGSYAFHCFSDSNTLFR